MGVMFGIWLYAEHHPHPAPTSARQVADPSLRNLPPSRGKGRGWHAIALAAALIATPAAAQSSAQSDAIIVTARHRPERVDDVPLSVTVASGDDLARRGISSPDQLDHVVPGFSYQSTLLGNPVYTLRGIGYQDFSIGGNPAVGVLLDGVPLPYSAMARGVSLDLDRVEVLAGPQDSGYGQGAIGGIVDYIAAAPTDTPAMGVSISHGRFAATDAEGWASGPIAPGLTARIAGRYAYQDGWQKPWRPNDGRFGLSTGDRIGARRFATGRVLLDWRPPDRLHLVLTVHGWQDGSQSPANRFIAFAPLAPRDPFNGAVYDALAPLAEPPRDPRLAGWDRDRDFARHDRFGQVSLRGTLGLGGDTVLSSVSAWSRYRERSVTDGDGTGFANLLDQRRGDIRSIFQELRASGSAGEFHWTLGGSLADDRSNEDQVNNLGATIGGIGPYRFTGVAEHVRQHVRTEAAFAGLDLDLTPRLTMQGNARFTHQHRGFAGCTADPGDGAVAAAFNAVFDIAVQPGGCLTQSAPGVLLPIVRADTAEDDLALRAGIDWRRGDGLLAYLSVARGYKPGNFAVVPATFAAQFDPVRPERVTAWETGVKLALADRRVLIEAAAFYDDYRDKQLYGSVIVPPFGPETALVNIPRSRVIGAELQAVLRPMAALRVTGGFSVAASRVKRGPAASFDAYGVPASLAGERFPGAPRWQSVADAEYDVGLGDAAGVYFGGGLTAHGASYGAFGENAAFRIHGYALIDLRAGVRLDRGHLRVELWGRNVGNQFAYSAIQHAGDVVSGMVVMPATYGVTIDCRR